MDAHTRSPIVRFTEAELQMLRDLANDRSAVARGANLHNKRYRMKDKDAEIDYKGLLGEYAVAQYLGLPFAPTVGARGDRAAGDLTLQDGRSVEVKFSSFYQGDYALSTSDMSGFRADVGILVYSSNPRSVTKGYQWDNPVVVAGWISRGVFQAYSYPKSYGYGFRLVVPWSYLTAMEWLTAGLSDRLPIGGR